MRLSSALFLSLSLSGCAKHTFVLNGGEALPTSEPDLKAWHSAVLWGLIELDVTDVERVCKGKKMQAVADVHNVWNSLVTGITGGIYTASTVKVWCAGGNASISVPQEGVAAVDVGAALLLDAQEQQSAFLAR